MPIYEYQCQQCGHELEALRKISDPPLTDCPSCQQPALQKLVSAASFRLKGEGWYETDFKSGDKKHLAESDSGKSKDDKDSSVKSDSKDSNDKKSPANKKEGAATKSTSTSSGKDSGGNSKSSGKSGTAAGSAT